ncbi:MAG: hypothetical protein D6809_06815 [Gammaproteobacteria bacterium]|nr:MAG: hypothetical protein D6809_06815 [Gammaproteobacteria bacterium]
MGARERKQIRKARSGTNVYESFSDIALLMLATFIFLLATILITSKMQQEEVIPKLKRELAALQSRLSAAEAEKRRLQRDLGDLAGMNVNAQVERVLAAAGLDQGQGKKDFELFIEGLRDLPGRTLHLVVDATGSMHGASGFLVPILRVIVQRSGKRLDAITWFADGEGETFRGSEGEMLDQLLNGAPFVGSNETIGDAFARAARNAPAPGAYLLIGDEPSDDRIYYDQIPAPVFTLPIGRDIPLTLWEYQKLADKTHGRMLHLVFR